MKCYEWNIGILKTILYLDGAVGQFHYSGTHYFFT